jgi:DNA-binding MarR family transcriptional regulator
MEDLTRAVRELYGAIERFDAAAANRLGIDRSGLRAVNAMERGAISPGDLSGQLGLTTGAVTALLDRLEAAGHVQRHAVLGDARRRQVDLSHRTRRIANDAYGQLGQAIEAHMTGFSEQQLRVIARGLLELATAFDVASEIDAK